MSTSLTAWSRTATCLARGSCGFSCFHLRPGPRGGALVVIRSSPGLPSTPGACSVSAQSAKTARGRTNARGEGL
eukprot:8595552-Alexandrium_andersonii.AAC.1